MNAKEALLFELGNFGLDSAEAEETVAIEGSGKIQGSTFELDPEGNIVGMEFVDSTTTEEGVDDGDMPQEEYEKGQREEDPVQNLSGEEIDACIEAATDAMESRKMPPEVFQWGLDYMKKMYADKDAQMRARMASIDWDAARARWAKEEEEEAEEPPFEEDIVAY